MCLRIILVGVLWGIVFTEGIRVIMLCNWHFDIFWPDHWRQAKELWQAGWVVRAPKEWAFVIILATFFPMLITGWWTLSLVAWERIIYQILMLPVNLYRHFIKKPINVITTSNKYGVVKRKSYKQIRPTGIVGGIRSPISDYNDSSRSTTPAATPTYSPASTTSYASSSTYGSSYSAPKPAAKKTDVSATIDHALFKFDDDDDDFDLDIDSFEKTDITKKRESEKRESDTKSKQSHKRSFDDDFDYNADDFDDEETAKPKRNNRRNKSKVDDFDEDETPRRNNRNTRQEKNADRGKERDREDKDSTKTKRNARNSRDEADTADISTKKEANHGPVYDALQQKGYDIISNIDVGDTTIDFIGVDENKVCLCLVDKENGDWLADEELFNGEEPLWFSENSHRISPVRKLKIARDAIKEKFEAEDISFTLSSFVVIQMANIINADDMFDIWDDMDIKVTRINRGAPKEIQLFSKTLGEAEGSVSRQDMDKLRKILKSLK